MNHKLWKDDNIVRNIFEVQMTNVSNPYKLANWNKKHNLDGYWYYSYLDNWCRNPIFAFRKKDEGEFFWDNWKDYVEKEEDKMDFPPYRSNRIA